MTAPATSSDPSHGGNGAADLIVLFGAGVLPGGRPSPSLARRVAAAREAALADPAARIFCTGGVGRNPPAEAEVMARLLVPALAPERLILDTESLDTLQSVRAAAAWLKAHGQRHCRSCSDAYHQPRIRLLFRLHGIHATAVPSPPLRNRRLFRRMALREAAAIPYDLIAGIGSRLRGIRGSADQVRDLGEAPGDVRHADRAEPVGVAGAAVAAGDQADDGRAGSDRSGRADG